MIDIPADATTLMRQASLTAEDYMSKAHRAINAEFGNDYAHKHPELVAAFMQTAALDFATAIIAKALIER